MQKRFLFGAVVFMIFFLFVIACDDHGLEPIHEGISGTIRFVGAWPDTTDWVRIIVFKELPASFLNIPELRNIIVEVSEPLPTFVDSTEYSITLSAGRYEWVVLGWRPQGDCALEADGVQVCGLDTLGMHAQPSDPLTPRAIEVPAGRMLTGVDIVADFSRLSPPSPIFP